MVRQDIDDAGGRGVVSAIDAGKTTRRFALDAKSTGREDDPLRRPLVDLGVMAVIARF
jgi:hypothetical protein